MHERTQNCESLGGSAAAIYRRTNNFLVAILDLGDDDGSNTDEAK